MDKLNWSSSRTFNTSKLFIGYELKIRWTSSQPKGLSFGFRPKVSVLVSAEMFRQNSAFRPKGHFRQKWSISAEISLFRQEIIMLFRPKDLISAEIPSFGYFLLSAEIRGFKIPSFGFGRNSFGWPLPVERTHVWKAWNLDKRPI